MQLFCPKCCEPAANVTLSLVDGETFTCQECNEEFTTDDVRALLDGAKAWAAMLPWVEACPARIETPASV